MKGVSNSNIKVIVDKMIAEKRDAVKINNNKGFMAFNIDYLASFKNGYLLAFSHYYKQNGDMIADPDMEVFYVNGEFYPITYQDSFGYQVAVEYTTKDNEIVIIDVRKNQNQLADFLGGWLKNVVEQQKLGTF